MRCPKCHYLSFEPEPRCRNCGYDLSGDPADLSLRIEEPGEPIADLAMRPAEQAPVRGSAVKPAEPVVERPVVREVAVPPRAAAVAPFRRPGSSATAAGVEEPKPEPAVRRSTVVAPEEPASRPMPQPAPTSELPLFVKGMSASAAAAPPSAPAPASEPPRPPLAVQRRTQPAPKPRPRLDAGPRKPGPFDGDLLEDLQRIERIERGLPATPPRDTETMITTAAASGDAERWRGLLAAALDAAFIGLVNVVILWLTLKWTNLAFVDASLLPALPLGTFFVLVALGYLLMFTAAGGQTVGKMIAGVKVVDADGRDPLGQSLSVQQAAVRSVLAVSSVLMLGLGFLPALLGSGKSLHDRLAHTRIVRA